MQLLIYSCLLWIFFGRYHDDELLYSPKRVYSPTFNPLNAGPNNRQCGFTQKSYVDTYGKSSPILNTFERVKPPEAVARRCSVKKVFLKI